MKMPKRVKLFLIYKENSQKVGNSFPIIIGEFCKIFTPDVNIFGLVLTKIKLAIIIFVIVGFTFSCSYK